jgi:hypothetical protein
LQSHLCELQGGGRCSGASAHSRPCGLASGMGGAHRAHAMNALETMTRGAPSRRPRLAAAVALFSLLGCASLSVQRGSHQVALDREHRTCPAEGAPSYPPALFDAASVVRVEPVYIQVNNGRQGLESRLVGTKVTLRPFPSLSAEGLASLLTCHSARCELGRPGEPVVAEDPYCVPGRSFELDARVVDGSPQVEMRSTEFVTAQELLRRATAFAAK